MSQRITGRALIRVGGLPRKSRPGATITLGGEQRTPVIGDDGVHGFTTTYLAPKVEATFSHDKNFSMTEMDAFEDGSITFETDTGKTYIVNQAWRDGDPGTLKSDDGSVPYVFSGITAEEA